MFDVEFEAVQKKVNLLHRSRKLENKRIYLFGASDDSRQVLGILRKLDYEVCGIIDNDSRKQNSFFSRILVIPIESATIDQDTVVLIYSSFWSEMRLQMIHAGVTSRQIYVLYEKDKSVWHCLREANRGRKIYRRLRKEYGDLPVFLCPYTGTGDVYMIGCFWKQYLEHNNIRDYIFVVISGACKKVALMFDIKNIVTVRHVESEYLTRYYTLCPDEIPMKLLNDAWAQVYTNPTEWFRGYKGLYFTELFRRFVFDLPEDVRLMHPVEQKDVSEIYDYFKKNHLEPGNTVILSPYSNTLADLPDTFWRNIVSRLTDKGYIVCTNSSGEDEPAIEGSMPVFFPLNIAPEVITMAGAFIGVRSGFCDVISNAQAKKIILYDVDNRFYNCSAFEYFSLERMGLCDDAIEIEFNHNEIESVIDRIMGAI